MTKEKGSMTNFERDFELYKLVRKEELAEPTWMRSYTRALYIHLAGLAITGVVLAVAASQG